MQQRPEWCTCEPEWANRGTHSQSCAQALARERNMWHTLAAQFYMAVMDFDVASHAGLLSQHPIFRPPIEQYEIALDMTPVMREMLRWNDE